MSADATTVSRVELSRDPYPAYRRLRDQGACVWLEAAGRYVVPRWEDVVALDDHPGITAREDPSLMTRAMGRSMLRTDGEEHARLRAPAQAPLRFRGFAARWGDMLEREAHDLLVPLRERGHMDVLRDFAGPFAARTLKVLLGLHAARDADLEFASQAFIDGIGNYADDPDTWERCERATGSSTRPSPSTGTAPRTGPSYAPSSTPAPTARTRSARTSSSSSPAASTSPATSSRRHCTRCSPIPSRRRSRARTPRTSRRRPRRACAGPRRSGCSRASSTRTPSLGGVHLAAGSRIGVSSPPRTATSATGRTPTASTCAARPSATWPSPAARTSARRLRGPPAGRARRAPRAAHAARHPPRLDRRALPGVGLPRPAPSRRHLERTHMSISEPVPGLRGSR